MITIRRIEKGLIEKLSAYWNGRNHKTDFRVSHVSTMWIMVEKKKVPSVTCLAGKEGRRRKWDLITWGSKMDLLMKLLTQWCEDGNKNQIDGALSSNLK